MTFSVGVWDAAARRRRHVYFFAIDGRPLLGLQGWFQDNQSGSLLAEAELDAQLESYKRRLRFLMETTPSLQGKYAIVEFKRGATTPTIH